MVRVFQTPELLLDAVGEFLGTSPWLTIDQQRINLFADATDDHQWIHVDAARAKDGPFGQTIAHGYLSLALVSRFLPQIIDVQGIRMGINYGANKLRFPAPVTVGSRIRGSGELIAAAEISSNIQSTVRVTVDIEGNSRPACVVDTISRYYAENLG